MISLLIYSAFSSLIDCFVSFIIYEMSFVSFIKIEGIISIGSTIVREIGSSLSIHEMIGIVDNNFKFSIELSVKFCIILINFSISTISL